MNRPITTLLDNLIEFSRHPRPTYPRDHVPGMKVPVGGSSCSKCTYLDDDGRTCTNRHFIRWNNGSGRLPFPADEYCSDWYED